MELTRLHPHPGAVDSATVLSGLALGGLAPDDRPYLIANFAATADGRAAIGGRSGPISAPADRELFHRLRTQVDAVLVGTGTLRAENYGRIVRDPELRGAREAEGLEPDPIACVVSRSGALPLDIPLFDDPDSTVIAFVPEGTPTPETRALLLLESLDPGELTLTSALRHLRDRHGVRSILCEGGPTLMSALLAEGLVDELFLTLAPKLAGGGTAPTIASGAELTDPAQLTLVSAIEHDDSLFLRYALQR
jgi:riboflavin-specific deaminase-like protein